MSAQEQLPSRASRPASPHDVIGVGVAFSAAGLYFMLGAAGYLPLPETNSPSAIVFCAGLAFAFAGATCMVRARAGMLNMASDSSAGAPRWTKLSYRVLAIGTAGALATIGTFIAIGSGPRAFSLSAPFVEMQTAGETVGRAVVGLARSLGITTVIEGIETKEQLAGAKADGCDEGQGYLFAKPMPEPKVAEFLAECDRVAAAA